MLQNVDLTQVLVLDIETVPQYGSHEQMPENFRKLWDLKTRVKRKEIAAEDFYERAGIWAEFGKIICISCGRLTNKANDWALRIKSFYGTDE
ncbi:MAG: 3'-5' exonuclease, partial [Pedobacter sp.]